MRLTIKIEGKYHLLNDVHVTRPGDGRVYLRGVTDVSGSRRKPRPVVISMTYDIAELLNANAKIDRP